MQSYFEDSRSNPLRPYLVLLLMVLVGVLSLFVAEQILTGWLPLGARANIPRSNLNDIELIGIIASVLLGISCLRTAWGLFRREQACWSWSQWMSLIIIIVGLGLTMSVAIPVLVKILTQSQNIRAPEYWRLLPGIGFMVAGYISYRFVSEGTERSDDIRRAVGLSPGRRIQVELAKSPSAGAIIGFVAIFLGFSMATDLFLDPTSVASVLTNVSTKGIIAIGVTILMISGEFDLSVGSVLGVSAMAFMVFMTQGIPGLEQPLHGPLAEALNNTGFIDSVNNVLMSMHLIGPINEFPAALLAIGVAAILGLINGLILVRTGIPSFIVTLGTLLAYRAITLVVIAGGRILRYRDHFDDFPQVFISPITFVILAVIGILVVAFLVYRSVPALWRRFSTALQNRSNNGDFGTTTAIANGTYGLLITAVFALVVGWLILVIVHHLGQNQTVQVGFFDVVNGRWEFDLSEVTRGIVREIPRNANFRMSIVWWIFFVVFFHIFLTRTRYGNAVFAVGGNVGASRAQGINVSRVKVQNFVLTAVLVGIAAIYETARNPGVDPLKGEGWELEVIAMTVIGGALLSGGYGSIIGSLLGALIFGMLQTGLILIGVDSRLFSGTVGVIIIIAVVLNTQVRNTSR